MLSAIDGNCSSSDGALGDGADDFFDGVELAVTVTVGAAAVVEACDGPVATAAGVVDGIADGELDGVELGEVDGADAEAVADVDGDALAVT
jgi:hypothetical protein